MSPGPLRLPLIFNGEALATHVERLEVAVALRLVMKLVLSRTRY